MSINSFILIFVIMLPSGEVRVAHEGIPPVRMTLEQCREKMQDRLRSVNGQLPWASAMCNEVPNGIDDVIEERPTTSPKHTKS